MKARKKGIYRCSGDGQTIYAEEGVKLPPCSCGRGFWLFLKEDNIDHARATPIFIGDNLAFVFVTDEDPDVGVKLNLRGGSRSFDGLYQVDDFGLTPLRKGGEEVFRVNVRRIRDVDPSLPIHTVDLR